LYAASSAISAEERAVGALGAATAAVDDDDDDDDEEAEAAPPAISAFPAVAVLRARLAAAEELP
jgi:hypothetical protein